MKKRRISIKTYILISTFILMGISHIAVFFASFFLVREKLRQNTLKSAQREVNEIISYIGNSDDVEEQKSERVSYLCDEVARRRNGRVMIISRNYEIESDTRNEKKADFIINRNVMQVMTGNYQNHSVMGKNSIEIISPIKVGDNITGVVLMNASLIAINSSMFKEFMLIGAVILFIFAIDILAIIKISRGAVSDLEGINEQMTHTVQGNLQERLPEQRFSETDEFADNFNEILSRLASIDQTRSEFVSNVSHELKTPITSMKVLAESITENEGAGVEDYKEFMTDIIDEIDRETKIINDLLTLVKTDSQGIQMNFEETDINEMLETIIKTVTPLAKVRNINIEYESFKNVSAEADVVKLSLAISNLVENAVKYNIENGWIKCSLNSDNKYFYIKVADSGVGIPDDAKDKVFDKFYRVDKARSRDTGGTGLGLAITRSIINAHRGTIKLYSESGKGTTFTVRIPMRQDKTRILTAEDVKAIEVTNDDAKKED